MASVAYQFIDHSTIDSTSRKTIRSHVMKGKNVGKVRATRRRPVTTLEARPVAKPSTAPSASPIVARPNDTPSSSSPTLCTPALSPRDRDIELFLSNIPARVGDEFDGLSLVYEAPSRARRMLHSFMSSASMSAYPPEFSMVPEVAQRVWVEFIYADEACFHSFVSMAAAYLDAMTKQTTRSASSWHHHARALRLISSSLSSAQGVNDFALAAVVAMSLCESLRGQMSLARVHVDGLFRMVAVRGGLKGLDGNRPLLEKTKRVDVDVALKLGLPLHFEHHVMWPDSRPVSPFHLDCELPEPFGRALQDTHMDLYLVMRDTKRMAFLMSLGAAVHKIEPLVFQEMLTIHCYRLLNIDTIGGKRLVDPLTKAVHLIQLCFMVTCIDQSDRQGILGYPLICRETLAALSDDRFYDLVEPEASFWALMMFGIAVTGPQHIPWLGAKIWSAAQAACIFDWQSAKFALDRYGWVPSVHDDRGLKLWNQCFEVIH